MLIYIGVFFPIPPPQNAHNSDSGCTYLGYLGLHDVNRIGFICVTYPKVTKIRAAIVAIEGIFTGWVVKGVGTFANVSTAYCLNPPS
jgi:hypothetical protein